MSIKHAEDFKLEAVRIALSSSLSKRLLILFYYSL